MTESPKVATEVEEREGENDTCVLCCKDVEIYSIGECDHPVCHECSTRLRVLCEQNECPICRRVLLKVIFTYDKLSYRELEAKNRSSYYSKKYKISFYCAKIQQAFFDLLDHPCPKCDVPPFRKFQDLKNHVRKEHDLHFCDLCTEHLKIFSFERRCYTQAELGLHRTKGDRDNRSHRGHPLCEYCKKRYLDRDELFRHLRRDHYFCHFCEADGSNDFYRDYAALATHFREDHYLCEEGKCATEQFIGAFRTEIDYKAHVTSVHGNCLSKHQAKQTRTLQVEITLGRHGRGGQADVGGITNVRSRGMEEQYNDPIEASVSHAPQQRSITIDRCNEEDFPSLGGSNSGPSVSLACAPPPYMHIRSGTAGLARTKENFPALGAGGGGGSNESGHRAQSQQIQQPISNVVRKAPAVSTGAIARTHPAPIGGNTPGMVIHVSNRPAANVPNGTIPKKGSMDFPALPTGKAKKNVRAIDEDMLPSTARIPMTNVAAKHRTLVDDYVSVVNPNSVQKIQMVQKEEQEAKAKKAAESISAPKLTSQDFPTLGEGSKQLVQSNSWVTSQSSKKQRELENRKSKVAPAPILPKDNKVNAITPNKKQSASKIQTVQEQSAKKDKKAKEKRPTNENSNQQNRINGKVKDKNNQKSNDENKLTSNVPAPLTNGNDDSLATRPPPGFDNTPAYVQPPPGFHSNVTVNSIAKSPNSLTFTSSLGESYSIVPVHSYVQPPNALSRNQKLVSHFKDALQTPEALEEFRHISQKFREGMYKALPYYEHCQAALKDSFDKIFPELLALLPDISKQQSLYLVHTQRLNKLSANQRNSLPKLDVCTACKQVLLHTDLDNHVKQHELKDQFPVLGSGSSSNNNNGKNPTSIRK